MVTKLDSALALARQGFHVFWLPPDSKAAQVSWPDIATTDEDTIRMWWNKNPEYNIGVTCHKFGPAGNEELVCIDVDCKGDVDGRELARRLEQKGIISRDTYTQSTPSGGTHIVYRRTSGVRPSFGAIGPGIDCLAGRRYFLGAGSTLSGKAYSSNNRALLHLPERFVEKFAGSVNEPTANEDAAPDVEINPERAKKAASEYLKTTAPISIVGQRSNNTAYLVAVGCHDHGCSESDAFTLMLEEWNPRCLPPWNSGELREIVRKAYKYAKNPRGNLAPEKQFPKIENPDDTPSPIEKINAEYALVTVQGGVHIIYETEDASGKKIIQRIGVNDFHIKLAPQRMVIQTEKAVREVPVSKKWIESPKRREYKGLCFKPGVQTPPDWYNLWRGFTVQPKEGGHYALDMFLEHAKKNVCQNDDSLFRWLIGYFAHLIQKPNEKPRTGLVFQGKKGVGKNALVDRVGALIRQHYAVTSRRKDVVGGFNAFMENTLLLVLNEVTWGGEKEADGILKNLVDGGEEFPIEKKYVDTYYVPNILRPVVIGNEPWLVSASGDERRYAVFTVGDDRRQDLEFFDSMRVGMEQGGYSHLLNYLLTFKLPSIHEINRAPDTEGLQEQKRLSLSGFDQWWFDCLKSGTIEGSDFHGRWPEEIQTKTIQDAFLSYVHARRISGRFSNETIGKSIKRVSPSCKNVYARTEEGFIRKYRFPSLETARKEWDELMRSKTKWGVDDDFEF